MLISIWPTGTEHTHLALCSCWDISAWIKVVDQADWQNDLVIPWATTLASLTTALTVFILIHWIAADLISRIQHSLLGCWLWFTLSTPTNKHCSLAISHGHTSTKLIKTISHSESPRLSFRYLFHQPHKQKKTIPAQMSETFLAMSLWGQANSSKSEPTRLCSLPESLSLSFPSESAGLHRVYSLYPCISREN